MKSGTEYSLTDGVSFSAFSLIGIFKEISEPRSEMFITFPLSSLSVRLSTSELISSTG